MQDTPCTTRVQPPPPPGVLKLWGWVACLSSPWISLPPCLSLSHTCN